MTTWRRIWQQSVNKQAWKECGKIQGSYFKIQDPHRSVYLCTWWNVLYVQSLENDSHQCRHLAKWSIVQYYSTIWQLILPFLYALSFIRLHTTVFLVNAMKAYRGSKCTVHSFLTLPLDGGDWFSSHSRCFTPAERAPLPIKYEAGYALVWTFWRIEKSLAPNSIQILDRSAIKSRYTHYAILAPSHPWAAHIIIFTLTSQTTNICWVQ